MNDYRAYVECDYNSIYHFGIKGQKWGIRRYQNEDGTLTEEGRKRYGKLYDQMKRQGKSNAEISKEIEKREKIRKAAKIGLGIAGAAAIGYGVYKGARYLKKQNVAKQLREAASGHMETPDYVKETVDNYKKARMKRDFIGFNKYNTHPHNIALRNHMIDKIDYDAKSFEQSLLADERAMKIYEVESKAGKSIVDELLKKNDITLDAWRQKRRYTKI